MMNLIKRLRIVDETGEKVFVNLEVLLGNDVIAEYAFSSTWPRPEAKLSGANFFVYFCTNSVLNYFLL